MSGSAGLSGAESVEPVPPTFPSSGVQSVPPGHAAFIENHAILADDVRSWYGLANDLRAEGGLRSDGDLPAPRRFVGACIGRM